MHSSERRTTRRLKLHLPLRFHRETALSADENTAMTLNVSSGGVYFITDLALAVGEAVQVSMKMPRQITGSKACNCRFTGRVAHIESHGVLPGCLQVGVHLLYYVTDTCRNYSRGAALMVHSPPG
jgi:PilZ domain